MAIFASIFALVGRFVGRVLTTTLGWASVLLFGRVPQDRQVWLAVLTLPEACLVIAQAVTGDPVFGWANLALGPLLGAARLTGGVRLGGRWLDARAPELLAQLTVNR